MSTKRPSLKPQHVSETVWYYESAKSLLFVVEVRDENDNHMQAIQFRVPVSTIRRSLTRIPKPVKR